MSIAIEETQTITCKKCGEDKSTSEFHRKWSSATGFYPYCKECRRTKEGHSERALPRVREAEAEVTMAGLIRDVFYLERASPKNERYRQAAKELREKPDGPHSEATSDVLFHCWNVRQRHTQKTRELDYSAPILHETQINKINRREKTGFEEF